MWQSACNKRVAGPIGSHATDRLPYCFGFRTDRFFSVADDCAQILPHHCRGYLVANRHHNKALTGVATAEKLSSRLLSYGACLTVRTHANKFFRAFGIDETWQWLNDIRTHGKGSPFLSQECTKELQGIRRQQVRSKEYAQQQQSKKVPVMSADFVAFGKVVAEAESAAYEGMVIRARQHGATIKDDPGETRKLLELLLQSTLIPTTYRFIPEVTRVGAHRGEAYNLQHHELHAMQVCTRKPIGCVNAPIGCNYKPIGARTN